MKLLPYILFEKNIYILALETASPENHHCADCILLLDRSLFGSALKHYASISTVYQELLTANDMSNQHRPIDIFTLITLGAICINEC